MATKREIEIIMEIAKKEADKKFQEKGLNFRTYNVCSIEVVPQNKMRMANADGVYYDNKIEIRRALVGDIINVTKQNKQIKIQNLYHFKKLVNTIVHEIGHYIHETQFNLEDFELKYMDSYGGKNHKEKFAVAFQEYITENRENNGMKELLNNK